MSKRAKKPKTVYVCTECGADTLRWLGKCPTCSAWNTLVEQKVHAAPSGSGRKHVAIAAASVAKPIAEVAEEGAARRSSGIGELDRVLGGGAVAGSAVLLGGDPGIGKSTLLMQALAGLATKQRPGLYISGEESAAQVAARARRLEVDTRFVSVQATTELEPIESTVANLKPGVLVVDSVQTVRTQGLDSVAGSVTQIRAVASRLIEIAKREGITLFLIGHVTKDGSLAGPKVLEHLVDTVLSFEGDPSGAFRLVRAAKNRFGPAHEVGVFEMVEAGLVEVPDPSKLFLAERLERAAGSVVLPTAEGTRPLLVEVQALVAPAVYGSARRVSSGLDGSRLAILLAVLDRKADVHVLDQDVFASVAGGARVSERAVDLPLALAIVSSLRDKPLPPELVAFGEVGLAGEVRAVPRAVQRLGEAQKLGFTRAIVPKGNLERINGDAPEGIELIGVRSLADALAEIIQMG